MVTWARDKRELLESLATELLHNYGQGRTLVAVDGRHDSGADRFADDFAKELGDHTDHVFRASMSDFFRPREDRERAGWLDGTAHYRHAHDLSLLRRVLIDPYRTGGSTGFVLTGFDEHRNEPVFQPKWASAGPDAVLVVDGGFLQRPELAGLWHWTIWVDGNETEPASDVERRNADADYAYAKAVSPRERASVIIDYRDPEHPVRLFADSC